MKPLLPALLPSASLLFFPLTLGLVSAWAQPQNLKTPRDTAPAFHITGTVIDTVTHSPVPHCRMTATLSDRGASGWRRSQAPALDGFDTDAQGHFDVPVASAGAWRLTAHARGYVTQDLDAHEEFSSEAVLTPDTPTLDVLFSLTPNSSITGIVLDEANEPVRQARITLQAVSSHEEDSDRAAATVRGQAITDDRGRYELANLAPGDYRVGVQASPWYAVATSYVVTLPQHIESTISAASVAASAASSVDPAFDVAYPFTWFPGVTDPTSAATITLRNGNTAEASFHLLPIPAVHLRLSAPAPSPSAPSAPSGSPQQAFFSFPQIMPVTPTSGSSLQSMPSSQSGQFDVGGLTPGLYQLGWSGSGSGGRTRLVQIPAGSPHLLDLNAASVGVHLTLKMDGEGDRIPGQVTFIDVDRPQNVFHTNEPAGPVRGNQPRSDSLPRGQRSELGVDLLPGRYRVLVSGDPDMYLTGISATGAEAIGRIVTVHGDASLVLHIAHGRSTLSGVVRYRDKPSVGALVLLIPATFGDPESLTTVRRAQSNTDGSYDLPEVVPGQYILLAIDHGWQVNWNDPATLRAYLIHGVPLDLRSSRDIKQPIEAQAP